MGVKIRAQRTGDVRHLVRHGLAVCLAQAADDVGALGPGEAQLLAHGGGKVCRELDAEQLGGGGKAAPEHLLGKALHAGKAVIRLFNAHKGACRRLALEVALALQLGQRAAHGVAANGVLAHQLVLRRDALAGRSRPESMACLSSE